MQLACQALGGTVKPGTKREFGRTESNVVHTDPLLEGVPATTTVWMSHGDQVETLTGDFTAIASTATCPNAAVRHRDLPIYGLQFHPEVTHTEFGGQLLANFVRNICGCQGTWQISSLIEQQKQLIRQRVGSDRVICGLSGGVDSAVTAALISAAIGDQLSCIFVDNGLLRKGERQDVEEQFTQHFRTDLHVVDASQRFLTELADVTARLEAREVSETELLDRLIHVAAGVERATAQHAYRFSATHAYDALVRQRINELREKPIPGTQTMGEFMQRRLSPAIATVAATSQRLASLSQRIERSSALLRTRVDIATENQNHQLLAKLTHGQELQLSLQTTVEGLSIAAISYYMVSLILYVGKALKLAGLPIQPELLAGGMIPVIMFGVWKATQRIHAKLHGQLH
mgnify:CR=1 FL=1